MNRNQVFDMFYGARDSYVEDAIRSREHIPAKKAPAKNLFLIAAVVAITALLAGCGIAYVLKMQNLKLGENLVDRERWDQQSQTLVNQTVPQQVLTSSGLKGSRNYQAALEWYEFEQTYDPNYEKLYAARESGIEFPEAYSFYGPYTQDMVDKIEEICGKYSLKLIGKHVKAQSGEAILEYLGIENVLQPGAAATAYDVSTLYYDSGYFRSDISLRMDAGEDVWPFESLMSYLYSPKDCFNSDLFMLEGDDWQERNYTTKSGNPVLVLRSPTVWESWIFCEREDVTITIRLETLHQVYTEENGYLEVMDTPMTDAQLNQILDTINFDLKPSPGDPAILEGRKPSASPSQTSNGYTIAIKDLFTDGYRILMKLSITAPEGTDLEQYLEEDTAASLRFASPVRLSSSEVEKPNYGGGNFGTIGDNDGKRNTVDFYIDFSDYPEEGMPYPKGGKVNLFLQNLQMEAWNREMNQREILWEMKGSWNFEITVENGDWREIEFISQPVTTVAAAGFDARGNDVFEDVILHSLKLRALGGIYEGDWEHSQPAIYDYRNERFPTLVYQDGTAVQLSSGLERYTQEWPRQPVSLEGIDYLELIDGTKLYPQY